MFSKNSHVSEPFAARKHFPLREVTGVWVSLSGSPQVRIIFTGTHYRLVFSYDAATVFTCPIDQRRSGTGFYLYGHIAIAYDAAGDVLVLSDYGEYIRSEEQP